MKFFDENYKKVIKNQSCSKYFDGTQNFLFYFQGFLKVSKTIQIPIKISKNVK